MAVDLLVAMPALDGSPSASSIAFVIERTTRRIVASSSPPSTSRRWSDSQPWKSR
jgi:hypothetical protein